MAFLTAIDLRKQYGPRHILDGASFSLEEGEHVGFVGVNGSGKSTLLEILAGVSQADSGNTALRRGAAIGYLAQEPQLDPAATIRQEMEAAMSEHQGALRAYEEVTTALSAAEPGADTSGLLSQLERLQNKIDFLGGYDRSFEIESTLYPLGLTELDRPISVLSGGERKRVAIGKVMLERPEVLILDEPTNHLDADTVLWLENELTRYPGCLLLVTHDRYFLDKVVQRILEIDDGKLTSFPGSYGAYLEAKATRANLAERAETNRQNLLRQELEWLRRGPKARGTKAKARIDRAETLIDQKGPKREVAARIDFGDHSRLGKSILQLKDISKSFGENRLFDQLHLELEKGERIGIIGPNGCGKTTLLKLIVGEIAPDHGEIQLGKNTVIVYFDQGRELLDPNKTIREEVSDQGEFIDVGGRRVHVVGYLEEFLFTPEVQRMPIRSLSGGERNRVLLAKLMKRQCNLLILDEPTNDLDLLTLQVLESAIARFGGCVLTVTHDRFFLNKVATSILAFEGKGQVIKYVGDYDTYRSLKEKRALAAQEAAGSGAGGRRTGKGADKGAGSGSSKGTGRSASKGGAPAKKAPTKLTWKQERELEALPPRIETLEAEVAEVQKQLEDPLIYSDAKKVLDLSERMASLEAENVEAYARWEELETLRESFEK